MKNALIVIALLGIGTLSYVLIDNPKKKQPKSAKKDCGCNGNHKHENSLEETIKKLEQKKDEHLAIVEVEQLVNEMPLIYPNGTLQCFDVSPQSIDASHTMYAPKPLGQW